MDARRLGMGESLPAGFLTEAATGYPSKADWSVWGENWTDEALAEVSRPVRGLPGPLQPNRPRTVGRVDPTGYTLAPYLEQVGRQERVARIPPESFWTAARQHATPADWAILADAADRRGLFRIGAGLRKAAVVAGCAADAADLLVRVPAAGPDVERWVIENALVTDVGEVRALGKILAGRAARAARTAL
jgi:hypothetical protein